ncbi:sensor histidine kinase [Undibacterium cyanobacteriorum]|uniref:histidine kinase n=1 Tax=Undibacterium cyanobacteriorum TaxID=3073561 RepID=A0ABY9RH64_9BURK|nr:sensor histidine kinase [Undibacterium sp. 20NA77.5]WMW80537.1 sensor histidine kinase [Undibacterium sp. 20NA77.5]
MQRLLLLCAIWCFSWLTMVAQAAPEKVCKIDSDFHKVALQDCSAAIEAEAVPPHLPVLQERQRGQWVKLSLPSLSHDAILDLGIPDAFWIEVFARTSTASDTPNSGWSTLMQLQPQSTFAERPVLHRKLLLQLAASAQAREIYIHYQTHGKTPLQMHLYAERNFGHFDAMNNLINGILFGLMMVVVPLVVLVFRSIHHSSYQIYAGLVLANLAFLAQVEGYGFQFLWTESPQMNMRMPGILALIVALWHVAFAIGFLQMRGRMVKLYFWHIGAFWLIFLVMILHALFGIDDLALPVAFSYSILVLVAAVRGVQLKVPAARFYLIGTSVEVFFVVFMLGISITFANPFPFISALDYPKIGYMGEAIFFAAAVWNQIRLFNERQAEQRVRRLAETEQLLQAEQAKLEALEKAKQQQLQLASASHDIAQPLASLRFAAAALGQKVENRAVAEHLEQTLTYAQAMLRDMIARAREEHVTAEEEIDVHQMLQQLTREFEATAQQKSLRLNVHDSQLKIAGSSLLLYRILSNLVSNALRYTAKGRVVVGVRRKSEAAVFQVWDTGPGMDPVQLAKLSSAFERGPQAEQAAHGFGLGLYIVNSLCRQCGYQLAVSSEPGKGSVFSLSVPLIKRASSLPL